MDRPTWPVYGLRKIYLLFTTAFTTRLSRGKVENGRTGVEYAYTSAQVAAGLSTHGRMVGVQSPTRVARHRP